MKVLFLEQQPCIRALKVAKGLRHLGGYELTFAYSGKTLTELYGEGDELFERWIHVSIEDDSVEKLLSKEKFDIIHSHNAPDFLTAKAIEAVRKLGLKTPIIHDNHDVITMRQTVYSTHATYDHNRAIECEKIANNLSDARIFVTEGVREYVQKKYKNDKSNDFVFYNYVPSEIIPNEFLPKLSDIDNEMHIVYEGTLAPAGTQSHYDMYDIFKQIADQRVHIHIYSASTHEEYKRMGEYSGYIHFMGKVGSADLLMELTQYDFGWAAFNGAKNAEHLHVVMANKVMEYIVSGLPVISFPYKEQKDFLTKNGLGVIINKVEDITGIKERYDLDKMKKSALEKRENFTVENNISRLHEFYKSLLA